MLSSWDSTCFTRARSFGSSKQAGQFSLITGNVAAVEISRSTLSQISKWADNLDVSSFDSVLGLHCAQLPIVARTSGNSHLDHLDVGQN